MAGLGDYEEGKPFTLKSGNKTSFKGMGSSNEDSPLEWHKPGHDKGFFQSIHGAVEDIKSGQKVGTSRGKKFKETKFGQKLNQVKEQVTENVENKEPLLANIFGKNDAGTNTIENETKLSNLESGGDGNVGEDYSTMSKGQLTSLRKKMKGDGTWGVGSDQSSTDIQNKINELYGSSTVHEYTGG